MTRPGRRLRVSRPFAAGLALATLVGLWSLLIEPGWLAERHLEWQSDAWHAPEITIAVASDLHVGSPHAGTAMLDRVVAGINAAKPDLVLLPGDFVIHGIVGGTPVAPAEIATHLSRLSAPLGVFATLGNHDWWFGDRSGHAVRNALEGVGIRVLENEAVMLDFRGNRFLLVGIGDDMTDHADVRRALRQVKSGEQAIVMMHDPANLTDLPPGPALAFAGHTHGGQIALPWLGALVTPGRAPRTHAYGWIRDGAVPTFVTAGVGTSILPVRFNRRPEYVIAKLRPAPEEGLSRPAT